MMTRKSARVSNSVEGNEDQSCGFCFLFRRRRVPNIAQTDELVNEGVVLAAANMTTILDADTPVNDGDVMESRPAPTNVAILPDILQIESSSTRENIRKAEAVLNKSAKMLAESMGKDSTNLYKSKVEPLQIHDVADINVTAQDLGWNLDKIMRESEQSEASRNTAVSFIENWFVQSLPFVNKGLTIAKVLTTLSIAK